MIRGGTAAATVAVMVAGGETAYINRATFFPDPVETSLKAPATAQDDDFLLDVVPAIVAAIRNRPPECIAATDKPHIISIDEYGARAEDPNGLLTDLGTVADVYHDQAETLAYVSASDRPRSQAMTAAILARYGIETPVLGYEAGREYIIEQAARYCSEHRLILTFGNEIKLLADAMERAPDVPWRDNIKIIMIEGSNRGHSGTSKRRAWDYVRAVMHGDHYEGIPESEFMDLLTAGSTCSARCLDRAQQKLDHSLAGICDAAGECLTDFGAWYKEETYRLQCGQAVCTWWRGADSIAFCRALDYPLSKCKSKTWVIGQLRGP